jgi:hypothetical protein
MPAALSGRRAWRAFAAFSIAILLCVAPVRGQEMEVPVDVQFALFAKIVSFDRAPKTQNEGDYVLGVLFQPTVRASSQVSEQALATAPRLTIDGRKVRVIAMPIAGMGEVEATLKRANVDALYVTPLRSPDIAALARVTRRHKVLTLTGVPVFVEDGLAVGVAMKGNRPLVVINLNASKAEGADFSSQLLHISKIIP